MIRHAAPRRGFTMIELLVVIAIIAILAGLLVVVIGKVSRTAKTAETAADIGQIASAISTYKSKMNVGYIPSCGAGGTGGGLFRLRSLYAGNEPEAVYLKQVWPQLPGCTGVKGESTGLPDADLDCNQTLVFFLTGGDVTEFQGFSTNRTNPFTKVAVGSTESRIGPFLTFKANRYAPGTAVTGADKRFSSLLDTFGSPFAYFAFNPYVNTYKAPHPTTGAYTVDQGFAFNGTTVMPYILNNKYLEPKGFQIISAGDNGKDDQTTPGTFGFGSGGTAWTPGAGEYAEGMRGADDIANFNGNGKLITQN
ncbi:type II secretion system protein [Urbifossiella limnaea]|uniref:Prepilin-type N-terminal cleavage/methylation domain-containing protein n=1 Tax=Urbifossiella limnaea TaxID=2528023 RepID=A0A517XX15_9BACT|nr:type II secretion system protein [Urbifossiella limnaea]QDU22050.1 hypothetical protein ETAA1_40250 [Urbifossiella limnaea]